MMFTHPYVNYGLQFGCGSKPRVVAGPPAPSVASLCRGRLFQTLRRGFLAAMIEHNTSRFVAKGFVAKHPGLLQTYVAKWPPKPVTNPVFSILCQYMSVMQTELASGYSSDDLAKSQRKDALLQCA